MMSLLVFGVAATWYGSVRFEQATDDLSARLRLPAGLQRG